ncbi:TrmB family transcriptional regulator [Neolewinella aurantiaca]|uniref:TrmB family transcriptional regulator n=1 Tax=Neolewinella aurantiaca TaxID=2602767 RepID=A0A5C7FLV3_9BACT|nr:TrmB family transcriptional regulator [Neolewinella aurantiaca]TXF91019.1 TrmB family transcriptional regulator [Neolewinella aurantiaca]
MDNLKEKVEEIGIFFESTGLTPMEARVFSLLLLSDPPQMDFFAIQEFLSASKSTISNALKRLMNEGRVDYMTKPGDRKRYFKVSPGKWLEQIKVQFAAVGPFVDTMREIRLIRENMDSKALNDSLLNIQNFFEFLSEEFPMIMAKWDQR